MPGPSAVLSDLFGRHPSTIGAGGIGGRYRLICEGCGAGVSVLIPDPAPASLEIRCDACGWHEWLGEPPAPPAPGYEAPHADNP